MKSLFHEMGHFFQYAISEGVRIDTNFLREGIANYKKVEEGNSNLKQHMRYINQTFNILDNQEIENYQGLTYENATRGSVEYSSKYPIGYSFIAFCHEYNASVLRDFLENLRTNATNAQDTLFNACSFDEFKNWVKSQIPTSTTETNWIEEMMNATTAITDTTEFVSSSAEASSTAAVSTIVEIAVSPSTTKNSNIWTEITEAITNATQSATEFISSSSEASSTTEASSIWTEITDAVTNATQDTTEFVSSSTEASDSSIWTEITEAITNATTQLLNSSTTTTTTTTEESVTSETPDSEINPWFIAAGVAVGTGILALTIYKAVKWVRGKVKSKDSIDSNTESSDLSSDSHNTTASEELELTSTSSGETKFHEVIGELARFLAEHE